MVTFRDYRPDDLTTLHEINEASYPGVGTETLEGLGAIADESVIALVAEVDGEIAGFCLLLEPDADYDSINFIWFNARYDDHVYLDRVAISERFHRQGIGRAMYAEAERLLAERERARTERDFDRADEIRDTLTAVGIEITDTPSGAQWSLARPPRGDAGVAAGGPTDTTTDDPTAAPGAEKAQG